MTLDVNTVATRTIEANTAPCRIVLTGAQLRAALMTRSMVTVTASAVPVMTPKLTDRRTDHSMLRVVTPITAIVNFAGGTDFQVAATEAVRLRITVMIASKATSFASGIS